MKAKKWILIEPFSGSPTSSNFKLVEEELSGLDIGDVLFQATFLTVDPYMRNRDTAKGSTMIGEQVCKVIESKNVGYPVGSEWLCAFGWRTHTVANPGQTDYRIVKLPELGSLPHSLALGCVGMPGATAYIGLLNKCHAKAGDTVLVNGAAGAVGSVVAQVAKFKGCRVIGCAGSDSKVKWLKDDLQLDFVFNYKTQDLSEALHEAAPEGVDVFYDNVGGDFSTTVFQNHIKKFGRVVLVGQISRYNEKRLPTGPLLFRNIMKNSLTVRGLFVPDAPLEQWEEAHAYIIRKIREGKLIYKEHITKGFENMAQAFIGLFKGENTGKAIVRV